MGLFRIRPGRWLLVISIFFLVTDCFSILIWQLYTLQNDEYVDLSNLKAFADNNFITAKKIELFYDRIENIVGKGENAGYQNQHFLLSHDIFKTCFLGSLKLGLCGKGSICLAQRTPNLPPQRKTRKEPTPVGITDRNSSC